MTHSQWVIKCLYCEKTKLSTFKVNDSTTFKSVGIWLLIDTAACPWRTESLKGNRSLFGNQKENNFGKRTKHKFGNTVNATLNYTFCMNVFEAQWLLYMSKIKFSNKIHVAWNLIVSLHCTKRLALLEVSVMYIFQGWNPVTLLSDPFQLILYFNNYAVEFLFFCVLLYSQTHYLHTLLQGPGTFLKERV